jgi:hypothetical protein
LDTGLLTQLSLGSTNRIEQSLMDAIHPDASPQGGAMTGGAMTGGAHDVEERFVIGDPDRRRLASLDGAVAWLNSPALTRRAAWKSSHDRLLDVLLYQLPAGLALREELVQALQRSRVGGCGRAFSEFAFEKNEDNVRRAIRDLDISYPSRWITTTRSGKPSTIDTGLPTILLIEWPPSRPPFWRRRLRRIGKDSAFIAR